MCTVWHYRLRSFHERDTKLEKFLPKNQHTYRKLFNFEDWISGGLRSFQKVYIILYDIQIIFRIEILPKSHYSSVR